MTEPPIRASVAGAGPDAPYVPTAFVVVEEMLALAGLEDGDSLIDLGSGDGRIPVAAARAFDVRALGLELAPQLVARARASADEAGVASQVEFREQDIFTADYSGATLVTMYLFPDTNLRLRPMLLAQLAPGSRIVSHDFDMGDWDPDRTVLAAKPLYLWVVPARVEGSWRVDADGRSFDLELFQRFQNVQGAARIDAAAALVRHGRLCGSRIDLALTFAPASAREGTGSACQDGVRSHRFDGAVEGDTITGVVTTGLGKTRRQRPFKAVRLR